MINHLNKPHKILFTAAITNCILGFLYHIFFGNNEIDIQNHDTYYVIETNFIFGIATFIYAILGFIYWQVRNWRLNFLLTGFHILLSLSPILIFAYPYYAFIKYWLSYPKDYVFSTFNMPNMTLPWQQVMIYSLIFGFAQTLLVANIVMNYKKVEA